MRFVKLTLLASLSTLLFVGCVFNFGKEKVKEEPFARILGKEYSMSVFHSFATMMYNHPVIDSSNRFPAKKGPVSIFVETKLLSKAAQKYKKQVYGASDWKWKELYLPGQMYLKNTIQRNNGFTDAEIEEFYKTRVNEIVVEQGLAADVRLGHAKVFIIEKMFIEMFPPDDAFKSLYQGLPEKTINKAWYEEKQKQIVLFYRDYYFQKKYGTPFPKKTSELIGPYISQDEVLAVASWMSSANRDDILAKEKVRNDIASFMITWQLFAEVADESGYTRSKSYKRLLKNFKEYELVRYYANEVLPFEVTANIKPNEENILYATWDKSNRAFATLDNTLMQEKRDEVYVRCHEIALDSFMYHLRERSGVEFLQEDYIDGIGRDPKSLVEEADSLLKMQRSDKAKIVYQNLSKNYAFTPEGKDAFRQLALLYGDEGEHRKAIKEYRNFVLYGGSSDEWCKAFFMIGYNYGEYLDNKELAAANYRWVLKNRPDCDLADDAEFMYLHLGEPVADIDELQAQTSRQGRKE